MTKKMSSADVAAIVIEHFRTGATSQVDGSHLPATIGTPAFLRALGVIPPAMPMDERLKRAHAAARLRGARRRLQRAEAKAAELAAAVEAERVALAALTAE